MAQLVLNHDIMDNDFLRRQIAENVEEIETLVPRGTPVHVQLKKISKRLFGADMRLRLFGRWIIVRTHDTDLFHALNRARRHLLRQVDDAKGIRRSRIRSPQRHLKAL
jgi:ribosome-associated translation inhibitor RaiA